MEMEREMERERERERERETHRGRETQRERKTERETARERVQFQVQVRRLGGAWPWGKDGVNGGLWKSRPEHNRHLLGGLVRKGDHFCVIVRDVFRFNLQ